MSDRLTERVSFPCRVDCYGATYSVRDHEEIVELLALLTDGRPEAIWRAENYRISGTAVPPAPKPQPCAGCAALREALQRIYDHALFIDNDAAEYWQRVIKSTLAPSQPDGEQP